MKPIVESILKYVGGVTHVRNVASLERETKSTVICNL
jgi:hypothetical protein